MTSDQFKLFALKLWLIPGAGPATIFKVLGKLFNGADPSVGDAPPELYDKAVSVLAEGRISLTEIERILDTERRLMEQAGIDFLTYWSKDYPANLKEIYSQPVILFFKGDSSCLNQPGVSIVGSRKSGFYAEQETKNIVREIAAYSPNIPIVSGLAYGIDSVAHQTALEADIKTIAVMANGLLNIYPRENIGLAENIIRSGGCLVTELPGSSKPLAVNFPLRNRIISGLSRVVLVMEAHDRSGALITAKYALDQNREVYALPGPIQEHSFKGCNKLIQQSKATLLTSADNFLHDLFPGNSQASLPIDFTGSEQPKNVATVLLSEIETNIMAALEKGARNEEIISAQTSIPFGQLMATLSKMQLKNLVCRRNGGEWEKVT